MATAQTIISRALRLIQVIASGASPTTDESNDCLTALNAMLETWRNENLAAYSTDEVTGSIVGGQQSYTLGPSGQINTTRPVQIKNARLLWNGVNYPLNLITQDQWAAIRVTTLTSNIPQYLYSTGDYPQVTLKLWPIPTANMSIILGVLHPFSAFASLTDAVALPPGYEQAMAYNLAICLAPEFGTAVTQEVAKIASDSLASIKRQNYEPILAKTLGIGGGRRYNIYSDF